MCDLWVGEQQCCFPVCTPIASLCVKRRLTCIFSEEKDERKVKDTTARHTFCICCASLVYFCWYLHLVVLNGKLW